jgi:hypothetical protein
MIPIILTQLFVGVMAQTFLYESLGDGTTNYLLSCSGGIQEVKSRVHHIDSKCSHFITHMMHNLDGSLVNTIGHPYREHIAEVIEECKLDLNNGMIRPIIRHISSPVVEISNVEEFDIYLSNGTLLRIESLINQVEYSSFMMSFTQMGYPSNLFYLETSGLYMSEDKLTPLVKKLSSDGNCYLYRPLSYGIYRTFLFKELGLTKISRKRYKRSTESKCRGYAQYFGRYECTKLNCTIGKEGCFDHKKIGHLVKKDTCWLVKGKKYSACLYRDLSDCRLPESYHSTSLCPRIKVAPKPGMDAWDDHEDNLGDALASCSKLIMTSLVTCLTKLSKYRTKQEAKLLKLHEDANIQIQMLIGRNKLAQVASRGLTESQIIQGRALSILDMNFNTTNDAIESLMRYATRLSSLTSSGFKNVSSSTDDIIRTINYNNREIQKFVDFISKFHNSQPLIKLKTLYNTMNLKIDGTTLSKPKLISIKDLISEDDRNHKEILGILNRTKNMDEKLTEINKQSIQSTKDLIKENTQTRNQLAKNIAAAQVHTDKVAEETLGAVWSQRIEDLGIMIPLSAIGFLATIGYIIYKKRRSSNRSKESVTML